MDLRTAMKRRGWNQQQLAAHSGVNQATVSRLLSGDIVNPSHDTVLKLERALRLKRGALTFNETAVA